MTRKLSTILILMTLFLGVFPCLISQARAVELTEIRITTARLEVKEGKIFAGAGLQINLELIKEHIISGTKTKISYFFELYRKRSFWMDSKEASQRLDYTVKYDNIKKQFKLLVVAGKSQSTLHPENFGQLKELLTKVTDCFLASLSSLPAGEYYLKAKASMSPLGDPSFLSKYILVFYSFDEFDTSWVNSLPVQIKSP